MKADIKFHDNIGHQLEVTAENDLEFFALKKLLEGRKPDFIYIKNNI